MYDKFYDVVLPQQEVWLPVKGYEGLYEVSNYGQVRGLDRERSWYSEYHKGIVTRVFKGKIMKPKLKEDGYTEVHLRDEGRHNHWKVHKIVSEAFHSELNLPVVDHKNDDKTFNALWNLKRCTVQYNTKKAFDNGQLVSGDTAYNANKLTEEQVKNVRLGLLSGKSIRYLEKTLQISQRSIARIRDNEGRYKDMGVL